MKIATPGSTATQIDEFSAVTSGLVKVDIHVSSGTGGRCAVDFSGAISPSPTPAPS